MSDAGNGLAFIMALEEQKERKKREKEAEEFIKDVMGIIELNDYFISIKEVEK